MTSNLACIGLSVRDQGHLGRLLAAALEDAQDLGLHAGLRVVAWTDPSGARLVLTLRNGTIVDLLPSLATSPGALLRRVRRLTEEVAAADVVDEDGEQLTALTLELEQRRALWGLPPEGLAEVTLPAALVALGVAVSVHADPGEFARSEASLLAPPADAAVPAPGDGADEADEADEGHDRVPGPDGGPLRVTAESFLSYDVFGPPQEAEAYARLSGLVLRADRRRSGLTGQEFVVARVRTAGFEVDVCLAGSEHPGVPEPGSVVSGSVFMVGSVDVPSPASEPAREASTSSRQGWYERFRRRPL